MSKCCRFERPAKEEGMGPESLFVRKFKNSRNCSIDRRYGISPLRLFSDKSKCTRLVQLHISTGICPEILLLLRSLHEDEFEIFNRDSDFTVLEKTPQY
jgi:hypothetical protein